jgi:signal transduction histidine kinase
MVVNQPFLQNGFMLGLFLLLSCLTISQLRENFLIEKRFLFYLTIIFEVAICVILFMLSGGLFALYLFSVTVDLIIFKSSLALYVPLFAVLTTFFSVYGYKYTTQVVYAEPFIADLIILTLTVIFTFALKQDRVKKDLAQELYDKLRISEEKLQEAYQTLEQYSQTIEELTLHRERTRISRELHDSAGHALSAIGIQLKAIQAIMNRSPEKAEAMVVYLTNYAHESLENVRRIVHEMRPIEFEKYEGIFAIQELIKNYQKMTGVNTRLILSTGDYSMNSDQSHQLYRIIQESLSNSLRHGKAKNIQISIQFLEEAIYSQIKDDGLGTSNLNYGMGLSGIRDRVKSLKGTMNIFSEAGKGFEITINLPKRISESVTGGA